MAVTYLLNFESMFSAHFMSDIPVDAIRVTLSNKNSLLVMSILISDRNNTLSTTYFFQL